MAVGLAIESEVYCHPETILEQTWSHWWVLHVRPRQDRKLMADIVAADLAAMAFFQKRIRSYPGKGKQTGYEPLLPGYVFAAANEADGRDHIFATGRVLHCLPVHDADVPELVEDLSQLAAVVRCSRAPLLVHPEVQQGDVVRVSAGVFQGCRGVVSKRKGVDQLVVNIHLLGTSVAVELDASLVDSVENGGQ